MPDKKSEKTEKPAEPTKKVAAKLFDDVKRPEETLATATSKPVIVGHTNVIKDPMVATKEEPKEASEIQEKEEIIEKPKKQITINPISADVSKDSNEKEETSTANDVVEETEPEKPEPELTETESQEEVTLQEPQETEETEDADSSSSAAVDAIAGTVNTKKERNEQLEKQQIIDNEVNDLINSKQFNVKIRSAPNKRKARAIVLLIIIGALSAAAWYMAMGPGKDLWLKTSDPVSTTVVAPSETTKSETATQTPSNLAFTNTSINTTFSYPQTWKVEVSKDTANPTFDVITLSSPNEEIDSITTTSPVVKAEVFMRAKIIVENTENPEQFTSKLTQLTTCTSEDFIIGSTNLKLLLTDTKNQSPNVSSISLSPAVCLAEGSVFSANDQVQLSTKQNTYVINSEYVLSTSYLEKNGIKEEVAVAQAQSSGITTTQEAFKATNSYKQFVEILKTLKEL